MFLKTHRRRKNGRDHCYYSIAENRRTTRGVVQRQVLYLGEINDSQREAWQRAICVFDEDLKSEREVAVYAAAAALPSHAEGVGVLRVTDFARSGDDVVITFDAIAGWTYRLERKLTLAEPTWDAIPRVGDRTPATNGSTQITDPGGATRPRAFYKLRLLP